MKQFLTFIASSFCFLNILAQNVPIGSWDIHTPYNNGIAAIEHNNHVYFLGEYGLFKRNLDNNENTKISKINGLSDNGFSAMGYHKATGTIIIGYQNGNLDLIKDNNIINIASIKKAQNILGSKKINDIQEYQEYVFLATDFGVVKIDVIKESVKETYKNITIEGDVLTVNEVLVNNIDDKDDYNDSLFLATDIGVMATNLNSTNLIDYNQWLLYDSTHNISEEEAFHLCEYNNSVYVISKAFGIDQQSNIFKKVNEKWVNYPLPDGLSWTVINKLFEHKNKLYISTKKGYHILNEKAELVDRLTDEIFVDPKYLFNDSKNQSYTIDLSAGFLKMNNEWGSFSPKGPFFANVFSFEIINNTLFVSSGGYSGEILGFNFSSAGYYTYTGNEWKTTLSTTWGDVTDIVDIAQHKNRNETYFASNTHGLLMLDENGNREWFTDSSLINTASTPFISPLTASWPRARVPAVETDNNGLVWFSNYYADGNKSLFRINDDGTWTGYDLNHISADWIRSISFDKDNNIWAITQNNSNVNGLLIIDTENGIMKQFLGQSKFPSRPTTISIDKTGKIWVGTNAGIVVFDEPDNLSTINYYQPIVDGRYLLEEEEIRTISVDGANRKWIGTSNGLYLYNADGTEQLAYFNEDNSPLLSNRIQTTIVHPETGELFIGTDFGILSFRTGSTEGSSKCEDQIKVFPNPVTPDFNGYVGFNGIVENSIVKITDVSGKLVYETTALGGQAIWNVKDLNQNPVKTGVYLAYISSEDGESNCVTKVAVVE